MSRSSLFDNGVKGESGNTPTGYVNNRGRLGWTWMSVIWWVLATVVGMAVGTYTSWQSGEWSLLGISFALAQGLVFLPSVRLSIWWVLATTTSWTVSMGIVWIVGSSVGWAGDLLGVFLSFVFSGPMLGLGQWLVLRHHVRWAALWILLTTVAYPSAVMAAINLTSTNVVNIAGIAVDGGALIGLIFGAVTGTALKIMSSGQQSEHVGSGLG